MKKSILQNNKIYFDKTQLITAQDERLVNVLFYNTAVLPRQHSSLSNKVISSHRPWTWPWISTLSSYHKSILELTTENSTMMSDIGHMWLVDFQGCCSPCNCLFHLMAFLPSYCQVFLPLMFFVTTVIKQVIVTFLIKAATIWPRNKVICNY